MKYSLVLHVKGTKSSDCVIYITDKERPIYGDQNDTRTSQWYRVGLLQNISIKAESKKPLYDLLASFIGASIHSCSEPNLSDGINIFIENFVSVNEDKPSISLVGNILVSMGKTPLGGVQSVRLMAGVDGLGGKTTLSLTGVKSSYFDTIRTQDICSWMDKLPSWVDVSSVDLDVLTEVGTDGIVDSIASSLVKKESDIVETVENIMKGT